MFVTTLEWVDKKQGHSAPVASKNGNKNFDLMADNENNNNLEISIYLANLNPPYKNLLFFATSFEHLNCQKQASSTRRNTFTLINSK